MATKAGAGEVTRERGGAEVLATWDRAVFAWRRVIHGDMPDGADYAAEAGFAVRRLGLKSPAQEAIGE